MTLPEEILEIQLRLRGTLPGESAHIEMLPYREATSKMLQSVNNFRESAVAILLFHHNEHLHSVLIQRPTYPGSHSGQMAFPGGKRDESDNDLVHTALREMHEEIGFYDPEILHLGDLTKVYIPVSRFLVYPKVFYTREKVVFTPEPREVEDIIHFPIADIIEPKNLTTTKIQLDKGVVMKDIPCFLIREKIVWGATALIMNEFRKILE